MLICTSSDSSPESFLCRSVVRLRTEFKILLSFPYSIRFRNPTIALQPAIESPRRPQYNPAALGQQALSTPHPHSSPYQSSPRLDSLPKFSSSMQFVCNLKLIGTVSRYSRNSSALIIGRGRGREKVICTVAQVTVSMSLS